MIKKLSFFLIILLLSSFIPTAEARRAKIYTPISNYKYRQKVLRAEVKEKYQRSLMPKSGYMLKEQYEEESKAQFNEDKKIPAAKTPKDMNMKFIPQPVYKLARYNNPPGATELHIGRKFKFDRQFISPGITSPNKDLLVYAQTSYFATNQCTSGSLYVIPLDTTLPDVPRIKRANIIKRDPEPILSTPDDISEKFIFRTMTPVDFSEDGFKLVAKEKTGNVNDGIWQTQVWVYDFTTQQSKKLTEIRDAITYYWKNAEGLNLDEKRWDIKPLGFDANYPNRIVVSAYGYTGGMPNFLGTWSIDCDGKRSLLESLFEEKAQIGMNGYKLVVADMLDPITVQKDEKLQQKLAKKHKKEEKKSQKAERKKLKKAYKATIKSMKQQEKATIKQYKKRGSGPTSLD